MLIRTSNLWHKLYDRRKKCLKPLFNTTTHLLFQQDICKTTIFYADQMCKRVVAAQGNNVSLVNGMPGFGSSINDGEYVRGRRRGRYSHS